MFDSFHRAGQPPGPVQNQQLIGPPAVFQDALLLHRDQLQLCGPARLFFPQDEPAHAVLTVLHPEDGQRDM